MYYLCSENIDADQLHGHTAQLICGFVFAHGKGRFSHVVAHIIIGDFSVLGLNLSLVTRKPAFCICENKDAEQLRGYREADQGLCFRYIMYVASKFQATSDLLWLYSLGCVGPGQKLRRPVFSQRAHFMMMFYSAAQLNNYVFD